MFTSGRQLFPRPPADSREKWLKYYSSYHEILLVGEGDFSFSLSLAMSFGSASNIVATSLDSYPMPPSFLLFHLMNRLCCQRDANLNKALFDSRFVFCLHLWFLLLLSCDQRFHLNKCCFVSSDFCLFFFWCYDQHFLCFRLSVVFVHLIAIFIFILCVFFLHLV